MSYCTVGDVRARKLTEAQAGDDAISGMIAALSAQIDLITGDHFLPENALELLLYGDGGQYLWLPRRVRAITQVQIFTAVFPMVTLATTYYSVHSSLNAAGDGWSEVGDFDALHLAPGARWPTEQFMGKAPISVKGDFSWSTTPAVISQVCAIWVKRELEPNKVDASVTRWSTESATFERPKPDPIGEELSTGWVDLDRMLKPYRRAPIYGGSR